MNKQWKKLFFCVLLTSTTLIHETYQLAAEKELADFFSLRSSIPFPLVRIDRRDPDPGSINFCSIFLLFLSGRPPRWRSSRLWLVASSSYFSFSAALPPAARLLPLFFPFCSSRFLLTFVLVDTIT